MPRTQTHRNFPASSSVLALRSCAAFSPFSLSLAKQSWRIHVPGILLFQSHRKLQHRRRHTMVRGLCKKPTPLVIFAVLLLNELCYAWLGCVWRLASTV